jgi:hypothetical protein
MSSIIRFMSNDALSSTLSEVAEVRMGYPFRGAIPEIAGGSVRVVQIRDVSRRGLKNRDDLVATEVEGRKEPDWLLDQDVLFVARGASNYSALVIDPPARTVCSQHIYVIRVKQPERLLPAFLAWQLNQAFVQRYLRQSAEGSHQLSIRRTVLDMTEIRIPPIERQRAAVELERVTSAERDAWQALIKNRETELAILAERLLK